MTVNHKKPSAVRPARHFHVLVVEDEKDMAGILRLNLEADGYSVRTASESVSALKSFRERPPDLVILDIMLPKVDGLEILRRIRQESKAPVILLTAKQAETDRVVGLRLGADDYVMKPFSVPELLARVEALLRRSARAWADGSSSVSIGTASAEFERHELRVKGRPVAVTPKELALLKHLVEAAGKILSRDEILERVWGHEMASELDTRTVDQHVARLRRKLGPEGRRIVTVATVGYRIDL